MSSFLAKKLDRYMTKRDFQASEYAAESYGKTDGNRKNTTMNRDTTPSEGGVQGEGTVGERLVERLSITQTLLDDNEKLRAEIIRLRSEVTSLQSGVQFWCNEVHRLCSK